MPPFLSSQKRFFQVICSCPKKRQGKAPTSNYLGAVQVEYPSTSHFHCQNCNSTYEIRVDNKQIVHKAILKGYQAYPDHIACIDDTVEVEDASQ